MSTLATRLRETREKRGLRLVDVDKGADLTPGHCRILERRAQTNTSVEVIRKVAAVLGVTMDWLVTGEHPSAPSLDVKPRKTG